MINLAIDTNIFRKNPQRDKTEFKALKKLISNGKVKLFMPYIIEKEFITQQIADCKKITNDLKKNLKSLESRNYTDKDYISKLLEEAKALEENTCDLIQEELDAWCIEFKVEKRPLNKEHLEIVIQNYFDGSDPFKNQKSRKDIPDAFIFQELKDILDENDNLTFIVHDDFFRESCKKISIESYQSLEEFIKSSQIQYLLKEHEITREKFTELKEFLLQSSGYLESLLLDTYIKELEHQTITSYSIPSDDNSAEIVGLYSPENIKFDCMNTTYYGNNTIAIPVKFDIDVNASFAIFKSDYYSYDYNFSVEDLNKHYYLAYNDFTLEVTATIVLTIDIDSFDFTADISEEVFEKIINFDSIEIDSIDSIEVKNDNSTVQGNVSFKCSNCKKTHSLNCSILEWESVSSDERQMGTEIQYEAIFEDTCDCGQNMSITFNCWEYPVGIINYEDVATDGVENLIGSCTPDLWQNENIDSDVEDYEY